MAIGYSHFDTPVGNVQPALQNGKFIGPFNNRATFTHGAGETCAPGEYRQYVKGKFIVDGTVLDHYLCPATGTLMSPDVYLEDGCPTGSCTAYGHRSCPQDPKDSYTPDRATGCEFAMLDEPGFNAPQPGKRYRLELSFRGKLINTTNGNELATKDWTVIGEVNMPAIAIPPQTTTLDGQDLLVGAHVRENLETLRPELHVVFVRQPGKTLLDPNAIRVRPWTAGEDLVALPAAPDVHQVETRGAATLTFVYPLDPDSPPPRSVQISRDGGDAVRMIVRRGC